MTAVFIDYASPSALSSTRDRDLLSLTASKTRPVRFWGTLREQRFTFRNMLRALAEILWSEDTWYSEGFYAAILDPIITVHPDRIQFEVFSQDQSVYGAVIADRNLFSTEGEIVHGTTNVDFTAWLWAALGEMRSSRQTNLRIGPEGFEIENVGAGGRFEAKVDIPDDWVRGFLQLMSAMSLPGTRVRARPVDLLAAIRFLRFTKAKVSPRALRYEMNPGEPVKLVLEPWEHEIPLKGSEHNYTEAKTVRTWGRRRLRLLEPLLPYADSVDIYLKGRALPSFYVVRAGGLRLVLGLSGFTSNRFTATGSFDLSLEDPPSAEEVERARRVLVDDIELSVEDLSRKLSLENKKSFSLLKSLVARGSAIYDVEARKFRHRELFAQPVDFDKLYPPDVRVERATSMLKEHRVFAGSVDVLETKKVRKLKTPDGPIVREIRYRDFEVNGSAGDQKKVRIVVKDTGQIIFGTCGCAFFQENLLNRGPCEHMLALRKVSEPRIRDLPTSTPSAPDALGRGPNTTDEDES